MTSSNFGMGELCYVVLGVAMLIILAFAAIHNLAAEM